jgi:D-glycero-D-manno-heptose 1,7-bisphosphate phosphatase
VPESIARIAASILAGSLSLPTNKVSAKGLVTHQEVQSLFVHIQNTLAPLGGSIDAFYYCPHLAVVHCLCRKPRIGMALQARIDFPGIDYTKAVIVGDRATDIEFGKKLGMKTVFVTNNEPLLPKQIPPADIICTNLPEFAQILEEAL